MTTGKRGRTVWFVAADGRRWLAEEYRCPNHDAVEAALDECRAGSRVALHLEDLADEDLGQAMQRVNDLADETGGVVWAVGGSLVLVSPPDSPPPIRPRASGGPGHGDDPSGDREPRIPIVPLDGLSGEMGPDE